MTPLPAASDGNRDSQSISSPQLASIQNPAPEPANFDWSSLLFNVGALPDGMNLEQATWSFQLE